MGHISDPKLPCVAHQRMVSREPPVVSVTVSSHGEEVNVPVPHPGHRPVAQIEDIAGQPNVLSQHRPNRESRTVDHWLTLPPTTSHKLPHRYHALVQVPAMELVHYLLQLTTCPLQVVLVL